MLTGHSQGESIHKVRSIIESANPEYWVVIDPPEEVKHYFVRTKWIVRHYYRYDFNPDNVYQDAENLSPERAAQVFVTDYLASAQLTPWAVMAPPAMPYIPWTVLFQAECVRLFAHIGINFIASNQPTGNDGFFVPGALYYGCQEYGWPYIMSQAPWHALRYQEWFPARVLAQRPDARLFILEAGTTYLNAGDYSPEPSGDAPHGRDIGFLGGYGVPGVEISSYDRSVQEYANIARFQGYVEAVVLYQYGANDDWSTFEHKDLLPRLVDESLEVPVEREVPSFEADFVNVAARALMQGVNPGEPLHELRYWPDGNVAYQFTTTGLMESVKVEGDVWVSGFYKKEV